MTAATKPAARIAGTGCGCGSPCSCEPGHDHRCGLDCQVRPRFFCGQLLDDRDLSAITDWAAGRFRLQRYRDGWGVVCGMEVRCDPANPCGVVVEAGYAIDCCGDDVVLCDDERVDLCTACRTEDPCEDPEAVLREAARRDSVRLSGIAREFGDEDDLEAEEQDRLTVGSIRELFERRERPDDTIVAVDLFVEYVETETDARASLNHSDCAEIEQCEPSRIREEARIVWRPADQSNADAEARRWCIGYERCLDVLRQFPTDLEGGADAVRRWLVNWMDAHPLRVVCGLRDRVCSLDDEELLQQLLPILYLIAIDCRIGYTQQPCHVCPTATGVPLARVLLRAHDCRVMYIDSFPPRRRVLTRPTLPAGAGLVNVGHLIGGLVPQAMAELASLGVKVADEPRRINPRRFESAEQLLRYLDCGCDPMVRPFEEVTMVVGRVVGDGTVRLIGLCRDRDHGGGQSSDDPWYDREAEPDEEDEEDVDEGSVEEAPSLAEILTSVEGIGSKTAESLVGSDRGLGEMAAMDAEEFAELLPRAVRPNAAAIHERLRAKAREFE